jgi:hypothetical protein
MARLSVGPLPQDALAAAATFHGTVLPRIIAELAQTRDPVLLVFEPADHTHTGWRLAAVQALARRRVPRRINAVASSDDAAIAAAEAYLDAADGVTGQLLPLDSHGAGEVIPSAA